MTVKNRKTFLRHDSNKPLVAINQPFANASRQPIEVDGTARLNMTIGRRTFEITILVADLGKQKHILLGRDIFALYPPFARPMLSLEQAVSASTKFLKRPIKQTLNEIAEDNERAVNNSASTSDTHILAVTTTHADTPSQADTSTHQHTSSTLTTLNDTDCDSINSSSLDDSDDTLGDMFSDTSSDDTQLLETSHKLALQATAA